MKSHYGSRWRNADDSLHGRALLRMIKRGPSLAVECKLPYPSIHDLSVDRPGQYENILSLNAVKSKYKTLDQLKDQVLMLQTQAVTNGRLFFSFNFQFVNFNRLQKDFGRSLDFWLDELTDHKIRLIKNLTHDLPRTNDWGDCFFIFENHEISNSQLLP